MKKDNDKKRKINLSFDNLAIPEVHLHRTHKDSGNNEDTKSNDIENNNVNNGANNSESIEKDKTKDTDSAEKPKPSISFDSVAIPEIHIKKK